MSYAMDSKQSAAILIDPLHAPQPSTETGPGAHFGSTFAPANKPNGSNSRTSSRDPSISSSASKNPYRTSMNKTPPSATKSSHRSSARAVSANNTSRERFPDYRAEAFADYKQTPPSRRRAGSHGQTPPSYQEATSSSSTAGRRRGSSLKERYPGDKSHQPLDIIRRDSKKAYRSPHLHKRSLPGPDSIDRLDPAVGGIAYHHEGPYDAASLSRNRNPKHAPLTALEKSNEEALKATPQENVRDALDRHKPLDGVAVVAPGQTDRFGRVYNYEEGADLMHEASSGDPGYKRWAGKDYDPADLKGKSEPAFSLDRAMKAHKISDSGIEMEDRAHVNSSDDGRYVDIQNGSSNDADVASRQNRSGSGGMAGLKKRIGSLRRKGRGSEE